MDGDRNDIGQREVAMRTKDPTGQFWSGGYQNIMPSSRGNLFTTDGPSPSYYGYPMNRNDPYNHADNMAEFGRRAYYRDQFAPPTLPPRYRQALREGDVQQPTRNEAYERQGYYDVPAVPKKLDS